ncbi:ribosomal protein L11 methylase PrmA [Bradyrhizobium sp. AZCC 1578]
MGRAPGSYRDPAGWVFCHDQRIYRAIRQSAAEQLSLLRQNSCIASLVKEGSLIPFEELPRSCWPAITPSSELAHVLEHPKLDIVSYPYEWPFQALKRAALAHIDLHLELLSSGLTLKDASAFNIQFRGAKPIFIDLLSIREYEDGEYWLGHNQFLNQFIAPLLWETWGGVPFQPLYRSLLHGVPLGHVTPIIPWYAWLKQPSLTMNVLFPAKFQATDKFADAPLLSRKPLPKSSLKFLLNSLRKLLANLQPHRKETSWSRYTTTSSYSGIAAAAKAEEVARFANVVRPRVLLDIGCNDGSHALAALRNGAVSAVGIDTDSAALDRGYTAAERDHLSFQPLYVDIANPTPAQGWMGEERARVFDRIQADGLLALAILHHLVIGQNVPLDEAVGGLIQLAPKGLIEFIPKTDPLIQKMLFHREDVFPEYNFQSFRRAIELRARIISEVPLPDSQRVLICYETR